MILGKLGEQKKWNLKTTVRKGRSALQRSCKRLIDVQWQRAESRTEMYVQR